MFKYFMISAIIIFNLTGCAGIPFQKAERVPVGKTEPSEIKEHFALLLPEKFQIMDTLVFEYRGGSLSFIGYSDIDTLKKTFTVVGLNQVGIKLFEITGNNEKTDLGFAVEEFTKRGNIAEAVAGDIKKVYFERVPGDGAKASRGKYEIVFSLNENGSVIEHVFSGADGFLVEKRCSVDDKAVWSVYYYEYRLEKGKLYPAGIILENYKYDYRLVIRLKEIRS
jgi:hypothetical protein